MNTDAKSFARLSREIHALLAYWNREGVVDHEVALCCTRIEAAWHALPNACRCDPPGSGEEWCTGHCFARQEE